LIRFKKNGAAANAVSSIVLNSPKLSRIEISMADIPRYDRGNNPNFGKTPGIHSYKDILLQKNFFEPLKHFKQLERLKITTPDTSQAFINYLSEIPNLKVLEWEGEYEAMDFSALSNVDTLVLTNKNAAEGKCELKLPKDLKMLILPKDSLGWILPALLKHPKTLAYLDVNYDRTSLLLLKDKVEHLILSTDPLANETFPSLANSMLKSLVIKINTYKYSSDYLHGPIMSIDSNFSEFKELKELDLSHYNRVHLSSEIQPLKKIEKLRLRTDELPNAIIHWEGLKELDVSGKGLKSIPIGLAKSRGLETLKINSLKIKKFPKHIYRLTNLRQLSLMDNERYPYNKPQFRSIIPDSLAHFKKLTHFKISLNAIKNRAHLRNIYKALPDSTVLELQGFRFKTPIKTTVNLGIYAQYNIGGTVMSGLEFNFLYNPFKIASKITKKGRFEDRAYGRNHYAANPFDFHTFTAGVAWNYLKSFVMGYKLGYTYTQKRFPIEF
jgi:Leucine-rich repeat (LRR) protein